MSVIVSILKLQTVYKTQNGRALLSSSVLL
jgi:hypothetical protein